MDPQFFKYIWRYSRGQQLWVLSIVALSIVPYYLALELPKLIVNGPLLGTGFETPGAVLPFLPETLTLPFFGVVSPGFLPKLDRMETLIALSLTFLGFVVLNGLFKYFINIYKGLMGERLLRRLRFTLVDRILRFQPRAVRQLKGGEVASMVKDEVEPLGGFAGDAFVQPALLGGQALTALGFIFVQNVWLGIVALGMVAVQFGIIPPLRRRLIDLSRQRQLAARELSGRVSEIVEGIGAIHSNGTSDYERADIAGRLGALFSIRYRLYQRKFLVKFLNNFLAQVTPFLFYMIGGYFTIQGNLDVGQLVAVINAYKELPGPMKELIDWDLTRQDVQVKYEQVVEQFEGADLIAPAGSAPARSVPQPPSVPLVVTNVLLLDDRGAKRLDHASLRVEPGETVAVVGDAASGADALAEVMGRLALPNAGKLTLGDQDLYHMSAADAGQRITYASSDTYFFFGTLRDNLLYGLKQAPVPGSGLHDPRRSIEARLSGNPDHFSGANWIASDAVMALTDDAGLTGAMMAVLDIVRLTDQVIEFALFSKVDPAAEPSLTGQVLDLRRAVRDELGQLDKAALVVPFAADAYNAEARVVDNLLFGVFTNIKDQAGMAEGTALFNTVIEDSGLGRLLVDMGLQIVRNTLELFEDLSPDHPFFERLTYMEADDIPQFRQMLHRADQSTTPLSDADRRRIIQVSFQYVEPHFRFGVLTPALEAKIVAVRNLFHDRLPQHLRVLIERYDDDRYLAAGTLLDNIVFGKINLRFSGAERALRDIITRLLRKNPRLYTRIFSKGLDYNLGASGRRLTVQQRQKLNFARALIRRSDFYVFNRALSGVDIAQQDLIVRDTLTFLRAEGGDPAVIWMLTSHAYVRFFQRLVVMEAGKVQEDAVPAPDAGAGHADPPKPGCHGQPALKFPWEAVPRIRV